MVIADEWRFALPDNLIHQTRRRDAKVLRTLLRRHWRVTGSYFLLFSLTRGPFRPLRLIWKRCKLITNERRCWRNRVVLIDHANRRLGRQLKPLCIWWLLPFDWQHRVVHAWPNLESWPYHRQLRGLCHTCILNVLIHQLGLGKWNAQFRQVTKSRLVAFSKQIERCLTTCVHRKIRLSRI